MSDLHEIMLNIECANSEIQQVRLNLSRALHKEYPVGQAEPAGFRDQIAKLAEIQQLLKATAFDVVVARRGEGAGVEVNITNEEKEEISPDQSQQEYLVKELTKAWEEYFEAMKNSKGVLNLFKKIVEDEVGKV